MAFEELRERLSAEFQALSQKIQDSSLFNQLKDRYENLSINAQKAVKVIFVLFGVFIIFYLPVSNLFSSADNVSQFEVKRNLIRDLFKTQKELSQIPSFPPPPSEDSLSSRIEAFVKSSNLLPEQIGEVRDSMNNSKLVPSKWIRKIFEVSYKKLNTKQIVDLGFSLNSMSPSVKIKDLEIEANASDSRYYDVIYRLLIIAVPEFKLESLQEEPPSNAADSMKKKKLTSPKFKK